MDQIDLIRSKIDLVELISSYLSLKKAGRNFKALCPFHGEKTPSFIISPERQIWKCFGCQKGGDAFGFLIEYEKMTFGEALRMLAEKAGVKLTGFKPSSAQQQREKLLAINHLASEFYHFILLNHAVGKKGLTYLMQRGISRASIQLFQLGYAPNNWDTLGNYLARKKGYEIEDLVKLGLVIRKQSAISNQQSAISNYYDRFRGRIIFPLIDHRGNILGFAGRTIKPDLKEAKYINSPETELYHKSELFYGLTQAKEHIKKNNQAVIVEGELDVISSYQAGIKNVVAIKGSALTEEQINLIKRFTNTIIIALDADLAGDAAGRRGIEIADKNGLNIRIVQPKYGKDPDECARHSSLLWRQSVKQAIPVFDFYLQSVSKRFDKKSVEGKKAISEELIPLLAKITNEVIKAHYLKKLANLLMVDEEAIIKEMERVVHIGKSTASTRFKPVIKTQIPKTTSRKEKLEEFILSLLLQKQEESINLINKINIEYFETPNIKRILEKLTRFLLKNKFEINKFALNLPAELIETFDYLYLNDIQDVLKEKDKFFREFEKANKEIEKYYLKKKLSYIAQEMRKGEKESNKEAVVKYSQEFSQLSKRLKDFY